MIMDGHVTVRCSVEVACECPSKRLPALQREEVACPMIETTLEKSLAEMLMSGELSDVIIVCQGVKFRCHKLVLVARSDVFRAMFSHAGTKEEQSHTVEIADSTPGDVGQMLVYLYTDRCGRMAEHATGMLYLADKYNLPGLRLKCELWIAENICIHSALDVFIQAAMHCSTNLALLALNYINLNRGWVCQSRTWQQYSQERPEAMARLFRIKSEDRSKAKMGFKEAKRNIEEALKQNTDTLKKCFSDLLNTGENSDISLDCSGTKFNCHKLVLAARSESFKKIFLCVGRTDESEIPINFDDVELENVRRTLKFFYTDECDDIEKHINKLLPFAYRYDLTDLKAKCERWLSDNMHPTNVADILRLADPNRSCRLVRTALAMVARHMDCIRDTDGWQRIKRERPQLIAWLFGMATRPGVKRPASPQALTGVVPQKRRRRERDIEVVVLD